MTSKQHGQPLGDVWRLALLGLFLLNGAWGEATAPLSPSTLAKAIRAGDLASVIQHLREGFGGDSLVSASTRTTALMLAAAVGDPNLVEALSSSAKQLDAREEYLGMGETALMKALIRGREDAALVLLARGADTGVTNAWGWNALHLAAYRGFERVVDRLLLKGPSVEAATVDGYRALHVAARYGRVSIARKLCDHGASTTAMTVGGLSSLDFARMGPWPDLIEALRGAAPDREGLDVERTHGAYQAGWTLSDGRRLVRLSRRGEGAAAAMEALVDPASGGRVVSWRIGARELLKPLEPTDGERAGGIPLLYPTPNAVKDARLILDGKTNLMRGPDQPRPSSMHGYASDALFSWEAPRALADGASVTLRLDHDGRSPRWAAFPRSNSLRVTYRLSGAGLRIEYVASNTDRRTLPAGFGVHPYWAVGDSGLFRLTATHGNSANFDGQRRALAPVSGGTDFRGGRTALEWPAGTTFLFGSGATAHLAWLDAPAVGLDLSADPSQAYLVLYRPGAGALCVEHQSSAPDAHRLAARGFPDEAGLWNIPPGDRIAGWVEYRIASTPSIQAAPHPSQESPHVPIPAP